MDLPDLEQEARMGLMTAAYRFDYRKGFKFSTFAIWWIKQTVFRAIADQGATVRVPMHVYEAIHKLHGLRDKLEREGHPIQFEELVSQRENNPARRDNIIDANRARQDISLDAPLNGDEVTLENFIPAKGNIEAQMNKNLMKEEIKEILNDLSDRERTVLKLRFGLTDDKERTLEEVAKKFGVSRVRIRQIEQRALKKLRLPSHSEKLRGFLDS